jgi:hypothetical protein
MGGQRQQAQQAKFKNFIRTFNNIANFNKFKIKKRWRKRCVGLVLRKKGKLEATKNLAEPYLSNL